jgi:hypothetical protein
MMRPHTILPIAMYMETEGQSERRPAATYLSCVRSSERHEPRRKLFPLPGSITLEKQRKAAWRASMMVTGSGHT